MYDDCFPLFPAHIRHLASLLPVNHGALLACVDPRVFTVAVRGGVPPVVRAAAGRQVARGPRAQTLRRPSLLARTAQEDQRLRRRLQRLSFVELTVQQPLQLTVLNFPTKMLQSICSLGDVLLAHS